MKLLRVLPMVLLGCSGCPRDPSTTSSSSSGASTSSTAPVESAVPGTPGFVTMPPGLRVEALELSGIAWSAALGRYLVVSDDLESGKRKHLPWLFAMTPAGAIEAEPLPVDGLEELNDPESICNGPDGTLFVSTSHSIGKNGKQPPSRRKLLHLALVQETRSFRILGQVDLTDTVLKTMTPLDIEAMAFREGVLYIGLKSPLAPSDGSATIAQLLDAAKAIDSGNASALAVWAHPRLCLPEGPCEGVADMTFLPSGALLIVGNSPKGLASDNGGALWRFDSPSATPVLLKHFGDRLKPEGITLDPEGKSAVIVFDTDRKTPRWTTWAL